MSTTNASLTYVPSLPGLFAKVSFAVQHDVSGVFQTLWLDEFFAAPVVACEP